ncbi:hypothetical protein SAMN05428962_2723 [Paenibacillus sp. BC26]|nr:hypothetical protein SAMN05428962_2723 [Paenibacillus sp. BC26]
MEPISYKAPRPTKAPSLSWVGFWIGMASIVLYKAGFIPLLGLILNIIAYLKHNKIRAPKIWLPIAGSILCIVYFFAYVFDL